MTANGHENISELAKALGDFQAGLKPVKRNMVKTGTGQPAFGGSADDSSAD